MIIFMHWLILVVIEIPPSPNILKAVREGGILESTVTVGVNNVTVEKD